MRIVSTALTIAAALSSALAFVGPASAQDYNDPHYAGYRYYADQCGREKHNRNVAGTVIGGIIGGLIGNSVTHGGGRTGGTVIGAAAGAAAGSNIARATFHCDRGQPYWEYRQTVEYEGYQGYPGRYPDGWYRHHHCRWVQSERGDYIRVCPRGDRGYYYPEY